MCEMSDLLSNGLEKYSGVFGAHSNTKKAFKAVAEIVSELLDIAIEEQNRGTAGSLRKFHATIPFHKPITFLVNTLSSKSKIEELREKLRRAKGGLDDSITYGLWELAVDNRMLFSFVPSRSTGSDMSDRSQE